MALARVESMKSHKLGDSTYFLYPTHQYRVIHVGLAVTENNLREINE